MEQMNQVTNDISTATQNTKSAVDSFNSIEETAIKEQTELLNNPNVNFSVIQNNLTTSKLITWFMLLLFTAVVVTYVVVKLMWKIDLLDLVKTLITPLVAVFTFYYSKSGLENIVSKK